MVLLRCCIQHSLYAALSTIAAYSNACRHCCMPQDAVVLKQMEECEGGYGRQRMMSMLVQGILPLSSGILVDYVNRHRNRLGRWTCGHNSPADILQKSDYIVSSSSYPHKLLYEYIDMYSFIYIILFMLFYFNKKKLINY